MIKYFIFLLTIQSCHALAYTTTDTDTLSSRNLDPASDLKTEVFTEKKALDLLRTKSFRWKQVEEAMNDANSKSQQSGAALLPHFGFSVRQVAGRVNLLQYGVTQLGDINYFAFGATTLQMSYAAFDLSSRSRDSAAKFYQKSTEFLTESNKNDLIYYLLAQYTVTQKWQNLVKNRSKSIENLENIKKLVEEKVQSEVGINLDIQRVQTRLAMAKLKFLDSIGNLDKSKRDLAGLLGIESLNQPVEEIDQVTLIPFDPEKIEIQEILENRPDHQASTLLAEAARRMVETEQQQAIPKIEILGEVGLAGTTVPDGFNHGIVGTIGAFLTVPLYTGNYLNGKIAEAKSNETRATLQNDQLAMDIKNQFQGSFFQYNLAKKSLEVGKQSVDLAAAEMYLTQRRFQLGAGGNFEVMTSQINFSQAQDDLSEAWFNYRQATLQLLKVTSNLRKLL